MAVPRNNFSQTLAVNRKLGKHSFALHIERLFYVATHFATLCTQNKMSEKGVKCVIIPMDQYKMLLEKAVRVKNKGNPPLSQKQKDKINAVMLDAAVVTVVRENVAQYPEVVQKMVEETTMNN